METGASKIKNKSTKFIKHALNININKVHPETQRTTFDSNSPLIIPDEKLYFVKQTIKESVAKRRKANDESPDRLNEELSGVYILNEINNLTVVGLEDGRESNFAFERLHIIDTASSIFLIIGLALATIAYDISFVLVTQFTSFSITLPFYEADQIKTLLLWMVVLSTGILTFLTIIRHKVYLKWMKSKKMALINDSLRSSGQLKYLIIDLVINLLIPYPFLDGWKINNCNEFEQINTFYLANDIMSMVMFVRVMVLARVLLCHSSYYSNSSHRLCRLYECQCSYVYVIKCLMKKSPLQLIWGAFFLSVLFFGYLLKISERPLNFALIIKALVEANSANTKLAEIVNWNATNCSFPILDIMYALNSANITNTSVTVSNDLTNYANDVWLMIVTMTTVGYGDYVPKTISGRVITFIACMIGLIAVSLMTIILQNILTLNTAEARSLSVLEKLILNKKRKKHSAFILTNMAKLGFFSGKLNHMSPLKRKNHIGKIKYHMDEFRNLTRSLKDFNQITSYNEEMTRHFSNIRDDIRTLEENINSIAEKTLQVLEQKNILKLNEELCEESIEKAKNEEFSRKEAYMRALRKLMKFRK